MRTHHRCFIRVSLQLLIISIVFLAVTVPSLSASSEERAKSPRLISIAALQPVIDDSYLIGSLAGLMPFPDSVLFPHFLADPLYPRFKILITQTVNENLVYTEEDKVSDSRYLISFGGKKSFFRLFPAANPDRGIQLELGFSFNAMVDEPRGTDFVGWDGIANLSISFRPWRWLALQTGRYHVSSHRADEFLENSGSMFLENYVRDSKGWAVMLLPLDNLRFYMKTDEAFFHRPSDIRDFPSKIQTGFEIDDIGTLGGEWSFAADLQFYEESDWDCSYTIQLARHLGFGGRESGIRIGLEYYNGRVLVSDFFRQRESYISIGIWIDSPTAYT